MPNVVIIRDTSQPCMPRPAANSARGPSFYPPIFCSVRFTRGLHVSPVAQRPLPPIAPGSSNVFACPYPRIIVAHPSPCPPHTALYSKSRCLRSIGPASRAPATVTLRQSVLHAPMPKPIDQPLRSWSFYRSSTTIDTRNLHWPAPSRSDNWRLNCERMPLFRTQPCAQWGRIRSTSPHRTHAYRRKASVAPTHVLAADKSAWLSTSM
ncbi:hypothetical protein BD626DRAFT_5647 [Schizophyllum amplum]|uniref:Uncharacterized protein n=1 Tax=Schizophyllum amplum TaxID=97359 RepID=A0A550CWE4_9AGAR|nr:hypothetical protein BD626DRAFT_5647 [Auriculariopsis ampla]